MTRPEIIEETAINTAELKEELAAIKKRDEELGVVATKTAEYLDIFVSLDSKKAKELEEKLRALKISRLKDEFIIKAELPEVEKDDIHLEVSEGRITLSGERKYEKKSEEEKQHRVESFYGKFERSFSLPPNVDADNIRAESDKGILTVHLPKQPVPESTARKIDVG